MQEQFTAMRDLYMVSEAILTKQYIRNKNIYRTYFLIQKNADGFLLVYSIIAQSTFNDLDIHQ